MTPPAAQPKRPRPVCVVTPQHDVTADRVIMELAKFDAMVLRLDLADFPHRVQLDAHLDGLWWTGTVAAHGRTVALADIGAVWWRQPSAACIDAGLSPHLAAWVGREATAGLAGILATLNCLHVNHPGCTHVAQNKLEVLLAAARCGLDVPGTWIGNAPEAARSFAAGSLGGVVCKSLVSPGVDHGDGSRSLLYTTPVDPGALDDSVALGGHQLQHAIGKAFDVRVAVVGTELFCARIEAHSDAARQDGRADPAALTYDYVEPPETVRASVIQLLEQFGLAYAVLDFLIDYGGGWWLVDLDPAGQFGRIERHLPDLAISAALAALLAEPDRRARLFAPLRQLPPHRARPR